MPPIERDISQCPGTLCSCIASWVGGLGMLLAETRTGSMRPPMQRNFFFSSCWAAWICLSIRSSPETRSVLSFSERSKAGIQRFSWPKTPACLTEVWSLVRSIVGVWESEWLTYFKLRPVAEFVKWLADVDVYTGFEVEGGFGGYPIFDQSDWKTIPFGNTHTNIASQYKGVPPYPPPGITISKALFLFMKETKSPSLRVWGVH